MTLRKTFAFNLRLFRKKKKFTQAQLAEKCDIATNYVGEMEKEKKFPSADVIEKLASALDVRPYILFYEAGDSNSDDNKNFLIKWEHEEKERILEEIFEAVKRILEKH